MSRTCASQNRWWSSVSTWSQKPGSSRRLPQPRPAARRAAAITGLAIQVARWTPLVTWPIGTVSQCRPGQRSRQMLRDTWPWRRRTPLTPADSRIAVTVMWNWPGRSGCAPRPEERLAVDPHLVPYRPGHALELLDRERVVPRRHRRVRREHAVGADLVHGLLEATALLHVLAQPLDHHERRVALVGVPHAGVTPMARSTRTPPTPRIHS